MADETKPEAAAPVAEVAVTEAENKAEEPAQVVTEQKAAVEAAKEKAAEADSEEEKKAEEAAAGDEAAVIDGIGLFKEESNLVSELHDPERTALAQVKELVATALADGEFDPPSPPPPPLPAKEEPGKKEEAKEEASAAKEDEREHPKAEEAAAAEQPVKEEAMPEEPKTEAPAEAAAGAPSAGATGGAGAGPERRARPEKEKALNCPRCNSVNTKFCYYNNYSLQQPRYFCKTCRGYWTEGGSLRNVPVRGGSKRSSSAAAAASTSAAMSGTVVDSVGIPGNNPKLMHDLNLALPHHNGCGLQPPAFPSQESSSVCNPGAAGMVGNGAAGSGMGALSALELLRSTVQHVQLGMPAEYVAAGFALGEFRMPLPPQSQSVLGFSLDTHGTATGGVGGAGGRLLFPFEDLKPTGSAAGDGASNGVNHHHQYEQRKDQAAGDGSGANGVTGGHETADS